MRKTSAQIIAAIFIGACGHETVRAITGRALSTAFILSALLFILLVRSYYNIKDRRDEPNNFKNREKPDNDLLDN